MRAGTYQSKAAEPDEERAGEASQRERRKRNAPENQDQHHRSYGDGMPHRDGTKGEEDRRAATLLKSQGHREQPSHRRIETVKGPEQRHGCPGPCSTQGKQYESDDASPPCKRT
jgi:hypothetical protein